MNVDSLPEDIVLQIFHYLPFKDRVRVIRVSKRFGRISMQSIGRTKTLELDDEMVAFCVSTDQAFHSLVNQCSPMVERMRIGFGCNKFMLKAMTEFAYPKLIHLEIDLLCCRPADYDHFRRCAVDLIKQNRSVKSVILRSGLPFELPADVTLNSWKALELICSPREITYGIYPRYDVLIRSLAGRVPNLTSFKLKSHDNQYVASITISWNNADTFLASVPNLVQLRLDMSAAMFGPGFQHGVHVWRLPLLKTLELNMCNDSGGTNVLDASFFSKMSASFPVLERFASNAVNGGANYDAMAMTTMKHLRELRMRRFAMPASMITAFLDSCPTLQCLDVYNIHAVDTPEKFVDALKSIDHIGAQKLSIRFGDAGYEQVLESALVKSALEEVKAKSGVQFKLGKIEDS